MSRDKKFFQSRVIAIGPGEGVVTGQSVAFLAYVRQSRHEVTIVNSNLEGKSVLSRALLTLGITVKTAWKLFTWNPDCLYITTSRSKLGAIRDIAVIALAHLRGVPIVNHLHSSAFVEFRHSLTALYRVVIDCTYRHIGLSIVLHKNLASQYAIYREMKIKVVHNFVSSELSRIDSGGKTKAPGEVVNVLFLSNLISEKGIFELVSAVKNVLKKRCATLHLVIAGRIISGPRLSESQMKAKVMEEIDGFPEIEFYGFADLAAKRRLLEWADVVALPSYMKGEGVPLSVLEGMAAGCYLIVSDYGILPDLIGNACGTTVPTKDVTALENALLKVVLNRELLLEARMSNPIVARESYSEERYVTEIDRIIAEYCK